ncbi:MAG: HNH endonuclease domain-containing protein, partial [Lentisphaeria bacterium]
DVRKIYSEKRAAAHKKRRDIKEATGCRKLSSADMDKVANCYKFTGTQWQNWLTKFKSGWAAPNHKKLDPPSNSGRSRYCRPALRIVRDLILSGQSPRKFHEKKVSACTNTNPEKGLVADDFAFLLDMPEEWEAIYIPQRSLVEQYGQGSDDQEDAIKNLIASHNDPIVRHRLSMFHEKLQNLTKEFGEPDHVVLEFIREDFMGEKAKDRLHRFQEDRRKERNRARKKMEGTNASGRRSLLKLQLHEQQNGICLYTGKCLAFDELNELEIDHAVPRRGQYNGSDSIINKVLTHADTNRNKGDRTPYEYLTARREWQAFCERVDKKKKTLGRKKVALLTAEKPEELDEKYTSLAETAWIARNARSITCLMYGWQPGKKAERRRVSVINGGLTARIRRKYKIDSLLAPDESDPDKIMKKNRDDARHHALDAMVLSYIPEWARNPDLEEKLELPEGVHRDYLARKLNSVMPIPAATQKADLEEMIYAKRQRDERPVAVKRESLLELGGIENKFSPKKATGNAKQILDANIRKQVLQFLDNEPDWNSWQSFIENLTQSPHGGAAVKKVAMLKGAINEYGDLSKDRGHMRGQYRRGKQHQGQFIYKDKRGHYRVRPVYVYESRRKVEEELREKGFGVFGFFFSNCVIEIDKPIKLAKGTIPAGKYVMSSLWTDRRAKLESPLPLLKNPVSLKKLMRAGMHRVKE